MRNVADFKKNRKMVLREIEKTNISNYNYLGINSSSELY